MTELQLPTPGTDPFAASRRSLKVRTVLITSTVAIILVVGVFLYTRSRQSTLVLQVPTAEMTVKLNGNPVTVENDKQGLRLPVIAGQYRLEIDRTNYLPFVQDVTIPVGDTLTLRPVFTLMPITAQQNAGGGISFVRPLPDRDLVFYLGDGGTRLYRVDTAAQSQLAVSEKSISRITDVEWPSRADVALITRPEGTYLFEISKYDFETQRFEKVTGPEVMSPVWDPNDDTRIAAALFMPNGERSLVLSDKRFTNVTRKTQLTGFSNPKLVWSPDSRYVAVLNRATDSTQNNIWIYALADGSFTPVTNGGGIVSLSFSSDARNLLLEKSGQQLVVHNLTSGAETKVVEPGTIALAAWRNADSFYLPKPGTNALELHTLSGNVTTIPYTLPNSEQIQGMFYFRQSDSLVFYTGNAVYTVSMAQ